MKKIRLGFFGVWRGLAYIKAFNMIDDVEVVAILDKDEEKVAEAKKFLSPDVIICKDYDELLDQ